MRLAQSSRLKGATDNLAMKTIRSVKALHAEVKFARFKEFVTAIYS